MSLSDKLNQPKPSNPGPHLLITARAGTGKTTTLVEGLKAMIGRTPSIKPSPQQRKIWDSLKTSKEVKFVTFCAFNNAIADELNARLPPPYQAKTLHKLGYEAVRNVYPRLGKPSSYRSQDFLGKILGVDIREYRKENGLEVKAVCSIVSHCKHGGILEPTDEDVAEIIERFEIELPPKLSNLRATVKEVLKRSADPTIDGRLDFDDMIWLPVVLNLPVFKNDLLLVDEAQDLNRCQQLLAMKAGERLIFCGDPAQAIYGFAGADSNSMASLRSMLEATERECLDLKLNVTRRCPKQVVKAANSFVPDFVGLPGSKEGRVTYDLYTTKNYAKDVKDGDMVLCRCNAPLVSHCFKFVKAGRRATIQGKKIGEGLADLIESMKAVTMADLADKVEEWYTNQFNLENAKKHPNENVLINLQDKYECLLLFVSGWQPSFNSPKEVQDKILEVFTDNKEEPGIRLSSIHKSKGLEAQNVWLLQEKVARVPHPNATSDLDREQEDNLHYVAITRALDCFHYVEAPSS